MFPMLASKSSLKDIDRITDYLCQPKLNGIRAIWHPENQAFYTRNGNIIESVDHIVAALKKTNFSHLPLDGEIFTTQVSFQVLNGLSRRQKSNKETTVLDYHIFDLAISNMPCEDRVQLLNGLSESTHIKIVKTEYPATVKQAVNFYEEYLKQGYEGIILREKSEEYIQGKTTALLKIKPVFDMEAELIGFSDCLAEDSKNSDKFGSLILRTSTGVVFNCSGLTDQERDELWEKKPIGAQITFCYGALSDDGVPTFPRFSHIRWDLKKEAA